MNYYQKYQKYRFKYLNLLNQSGGKYYKEDLDKVRINGLQLKNVNIPNTESDDLPYFAVCKIAVQQNGLALQYLKLDEIRNAIKKYEENIYYNKYNIENEKITNKIYKENFIKYLNDYKEDISEICRLAFEQNILAFKHVNNIIKIIINIKPDLIIIDKTIYYNMCIKAVERDGNELEHVRDYNLSSTPISFGGDKPYEAICKAAVQQKGFALRHVPTNIIPIVSRQIMELAVQQNGLVLECINDNERYNRAKLGDKKEVFNPICPTYYEIICKEAVKQNSLALKFVDKEKMDDTEYKNICDLAVKQNPDAQKYIK